jgi:peptide-methionine (R)-S-oxide reductase
MNRRHLLKTAAAALLLRAGIAPAQYLRVASRPGTMIDDLQRNWKELLAPGATIAANSQPIEHSDAEWRRLLAPAAYDVLRHEGTEPPFSSPLDGEKRRGVFACAGCALPLFSSDMKFDSSTGWPSYFTTILGAFATKTDVKLILPRTEYHCTKCGCHHGHVFDDGPKPTGQRWCNNGVALRFIPARA